MSVRLASVLDAEILGVAATAASARFNHRAHDVLDRATWHRCRAGADSVIRRRRRARADLLGRLRVRWRPQQALAEHTA